MSSHQSKEKRDNTSTSPIDRIAIKIRGVENSELQAVTDSWRRGGWDNGFKCVEFALDDDMCPNKCFAAELNGQIIGTGFAYKINDNLGGLAGFNVAPEYRNMGVGQLIWDTRLQFLDQRNIFVASLWRRSIKNISLGFDKIAYEGSILSGVPKIQALDSGNDNSFVDEVMNISEVDFKKLLSYDTSIHGEIPREQYLKTVIHKYQCRGFAAIKGGQVVGYIGEIPNEPKVAIGPLYADNEKVASVLLRKFLSILRENEPVQVFAIYPCGTAESASCLQLFKAIGLSQEDRFRGLFNKEIIPVNLKKIYAMSSFITYLC